MVHIPPIDMVANKDRLVPLLKHLNTLEKPTWSKVRLALNRFPSRNGYFKKTDILEAFRILSGKNGITPPSDSLKKLLQVKPVRTLSGVTPVTVLTKPYPCPGECIFCPSDIRMPKSYLSLEPGAQRAAHHRFDPYLQTYNRLKAFKAMGHVHDKVELLVLGGTWSVYPATYRLWFIKRLFEALNDFGQGVDQTVTIKTQQTLTLPSTDPGKYQTLVDHTKYKNYNQAVTAQYDTLPHPLETATFEELEREHRRNETSAIKCVGLVLETRPDYLTHQEAVMLRRLGATKIQIGLQSLDDTVLSANRRGHSVKAAANAINILRSYGFKLHVHMMPNLYQATPESDKKDLQKLFSDPHFSPDELKLYPCSLIEGTELNLHFNAGRWQPYDHETLLDVVTHAVEHTPRWCRISRVVRDIPSHDIVTGNKFTNFRQMADAELVKRGRQSVDIRAREIKNHRFDSKTLTLKETSYPSGIGTEIFLEYVTPTDNIAGFLRLSLPKTWSKNLPSELHQAAIIREVHVYGQAVTVGGKQPSAAQHLGLGKKLIQHALHLAKAAGYPWVAVISAVGTREYYRKQGFLDGDLYQQIKS
jgi:elongator complex protein 3